MGIVAKLQPKQVELWNAMETGDETFVGFGGALGSAKSHGIRAINVLRRDRYENTRSLIFRNTIPELRNNHIDPMFAEWPELRQYWNQQEKSLRFPNGSMTIFGAADDDRGMGSFVGPEYDDIFIDQAEQIREDYIGALSERCRGTKNQRIRRHVVPTANPGGISHGFLKRLFIDRKFKGNEVPSDYRFIHARAWDNVEWSLTELEKDGLTPHDYYNVWTDEQRFTFFITRTAYGKRLNALPDKRRKAMLLGSWAEYDGQYFDIFDPDKTPIATELLGLRPGLPRIISCDYGWSHKASAYWHAQLTATIRATYREFSAAGKSPEILAHSIGRLTNGEKIDRFILGADSFRLVHGEESIATKMARVLADYGIPEPEMADMKPGSRAVRARAAYDRMADHTWLISTACKDLIDCLPNLVHDPDDREDVLKIDGDDPYDGATYGLMAEGVEVKKTMAEKLDERAAEIPQEDLTSRSMMLMQIENEERRRSRHFARMGGARR